MFAADGRQVSVKESVPLNEAQSTHGDPGWMKDFCRPWENNSCPGGRR